MDYVYGLYVRIHMQVCKLNWKLHERLMYILVGSFTVAAACSRMSLFVSFVVDFIESTSRSTYSAWLIGCLYTKPFAVAHAQVLLIMVLESMHAACNSINSKAKWNAISIASSHIYRSRACIVVALQPKFSSQWYTSASIFLVTGFSTLFSFTAWERSCVAHASTASKDPDLSQASFNFWPQLAVFWKCWHTGMHAHSHWVIDI